MKTVSQKIGANIKVQCAKDGREAIAAAGCAAAGRPFDLVLLDTVMPHVDGFEALPHIRRMLPDAAIVAFSSTLTAAETLLYKQGGADAFAEGLMSPTELMELMTALNILPLREIYSPEDEIAPNSATVAVATAPDTDALALNSAVPVPTGLQVFSDSPTVFDAALPSPPTGNFYQRRGAAMQQHGFHARPPPQQSVVAHPPASHASAMSTVRPQYASLAPQWPHPDRPAPPSASLSYPSDPWQPSQLTRQRNAGGHSLAAGDIRDIRHRTPRLSALWYDPSPRQPPPHQPPPHQPLASYAYGASHTSLASQRSLTARLHDIAQAVPPSPARSGHGQHGTWMGVGPPPSFSAARAVPQSHVSRGTLGGITTPAYLPPRVLATLRPFVTCLCCGRRLEKKKVLNAVDLSRTTVNWGAP